MCGRGGSSAASLNALAVSLNAVAVEVKDCIDAARLLFVGLWELSGFNAGCLSNDGRLLLLDTPDALRGEDATTGKLSVCCEPCDRRPDAINDPKLWNDFNGGGNVCGVATRRALSSHAPKSAGSQSKYPPAS